MIAPIRLIAAEPISTYACPQCGFPLNFHFSDSPAERPAIVCLVGCSRCCWFENWGAWTPRKPEENNIVRLDARR